MTRADNLQRIIDLCDRGFITYDRSLYAAIESLADEMLADGEQIATIKGLASAGPNLVSPRFAYPHIKNAALDALRA